MNFFRNHRQLQTLAGLLTFACLGISTPTWAEDPPDAPKAELFAEIQKADAEFFKAFNSCDLDTIGRMFSKDLEFFHDTAGLGDYEQNMKNSRALCERNLGLVRTLVEGSMDVYPVPGFGAIQTGQHT
ncbi:MAG: nuclear transport factor 2 family protein, partial [Acidobacteriota bacterium]